MGIYDREYYHEESAVRNGGLLKGHSAVVVMIAINIVVFLLWQITEIRSFMATHFVVEKAGVFKGLIHTLFTSSISHQDLWHIIFNMFFLYWFGTDLEEIYGPRDFILFYVVAGVISSIGHILVEPNSGALGASGSVMGVVIACACFYPDKRINLLLGLLFPISIRLKWLAAFYVVMDLLGATNQAESGTAHAAHLGGALAGFLFYKFDLRLFGLARTVNSKKIGVTRRLLMFLFPTDDLSRLRWRARWRRLFPGRPNLRIVENRTPPLNRSVPSSGRVPHVAPSLEVVSVDSDTAQRVDALLKKISSEGIGALTAEERSFLESSSKKYKR